MVSIFAIIVHYGDVNDTLSAIQSLLDTNKNHLQLDIVLIDNDPKNRIAIKDLTDSQIIKLIRMKKNAGFAAGVNIGLKEAMKKNADFVLLLNNDVIVQKNIFTKILPFFKKNGVGMLSPAITYYDKPTIVWCVDGHLNKTLLFTKHTYMNKDLRSLSLPSYIESDFAAACLFIRNDVIKKVGLFDEKYFLYVEDVEWCFRAKKAGFRLLYITYPLAKHKVSASAGIKGTNILTPLTAFYYARNFFLLLRDHKRSFHISAALIGQTCIRLPFYILFRSSTIKTAISYLRGYVAGLYYLITGKLVQF